MTRHASDSRHENGLSLVELMVAMGLAGVVSGLVLSIYSRSAVSYQTQTRVAELQGTVRSATDLLARDIRQTGFSTKQLSYWNGSAVVAVDGIRVDNSADALGSDTVTLVTASGASNMDPFGAAAVFVSCNGAGCSANKFMATLSAPPLAVNNTIIATDSAGNSCVSCVTKVDIVGATSGGASGGSGGSSGWTDTGQRFETKTGGGSATAACKAMNQGSNAQCAGLSYGPGTTFQQVNLLAMPTFFYRTYRIHPTDARGRLQICLLNPATACTNDTNPATDWTDLALGFVDLQIALRVYDGDGTDQDGDGQNGYDWFSGNNMETVMTVGEIVAMKFSLVGRSLSEVETVVPASGRAPDLGVTVACAQPNCYNRIGDHVGIALPNNVSTSRYYSGSATRERHVYRYSSVTIDLRNMSNP